MNFIRTNHHFAGLFFTLLLSLFPQSSDSQNNTENILSGGNFRLAGALPYSVYSSALDSSGNVYLGSENFLLCYSQGFQQRIPMQGHVFVCSLNKDMIAAAGRSSSGIVRWDEKQQVFSISLIPGIQKGAGQVRQLVSAGDKLLLRFDRHLFLYAGTKLSTLDSTGSIFLLGRNSEGDPLVFSKRGVFKLAATQLQEVEVNPFKGEADSVQMPAPSISMLVAGTDTFYHPTDYQNGGTLELGSSSNFLLVKFSTTSPLASDGVFYKVYLEGRMKPLTSLMQSPEFFFNEIETGTYTLRVVAMDAGGRESAPYILHILVLKPFYLRWYTLISILFLLPIALILLLRWRSWRFLHEKIRIEDLISKRTEELTRERDKSEELIANILPKDTADELKKKGKASSQKYELVTVLFSDIQGFTRIAEQMNPETLIDQLDTFYFQFDSVAEKYNIEKIKTIGDAYMCAGGIPDKNTTNPVEVVLAGLEMQQFMKDLKETDANIWDLRIGIHTGPVIAGVVGHKKFSYDIWGDTVNVASRMESSGEAGKVNISGHTYDLVKDFFICEYRGKMPVKYKGEVDMYFVKGIRPELSLNMKGTPNRHFFTQLQKLRLMDLEEFIMDVIEKTSPASLYFHNRAYTAEVYMQCELLGRAEGVSDEELLLLCTAGLLQGIGYILDYADPIARSAGYAAEILGGFKYDQGQVDVIVRLLRSLRSEGEFTSNLEKIFSDACLNYIGRPDFPRLSAMHLQEVNEHGKHYSAEEWVQRQEKFLHQHLFYTNAAKRLREFDASMQIQALKAYFSQIGRAGD